MRRPFYLSHLYSHDMNIYGDRGNVIALTKRLQWRGFEVIVEEINIGDRLDPRRCDLVFAGGGQDDQQHVVAEELRLWNGAILRDLADSGVPMLLVCGTYQLFGHWFRTGDGREIEGIGLLDLHTIAGKRRLIGDSLVDSTIGDGSRTLVGFENHSGQTFLGPKCAPLGKVLVGGGNNGQDGREGAVYRNVHGTYLHGPILPKNPWFTDYLLGAALARQGMNEPLDPLDDRWEMRAHSTIVDRVRRRGRRASGVV